MLKVISLRIYPSLSAKLKLMALGAIKQLKSSKVEYMVEGDAHRLYQTILNAIILACGLNNSCQWTVGISRYCRAHVTKRDEMPRYFFIIYKILTDSLSLYVCAY